MNKIYLIMIALLFIGCTGKTPVTDREQIIFMSESEEKTLGENSYREFLKNAKLSSDKAQTARVKNIGKKIAIAADRVDFEWEFNLIEDKQINAFCMPGGKVVVYTGILLVAKNDDQLATVMSHEVAHALARHGAERMSHQQISSGIQTLGNIIIGTTAPGYSDAFNIAYGYGTQLGVMLPYSRSHEYEADAIGIYLMKQAGYDINEAVKFWQNMKALKGQTQSEFFSTHPSDDNRIERISEIIKEMNK
ncbi:M48 family metallopeptidase [Sulfurimonas sp.]|jgi:predicted Zn-dependent protease|uniref:M48 family metallopeptidase n=1 Tax=Sulfurimonas sp. TaxID=2022749 RepID=UPI0025E6C918|nr:M48 family metallopeptidase [Sulfurimonas sp.]MCK9473014.1 M48 family metallopeptidase [Sulfurimonas sp.]MDD3506170.1 M48 family metallopeptidase [Sulfurimonas sp.]